MLYIKWSSGALILGSDDHKVSQDEDYGQWTMDILLPVGGQGDQGGQGGQGDQSGQGGQGHQGGLR